MKNFKIDIPNYDPARGNSCMLLGYIKAKVIKAQRNLAQGNQEAAAHILEKLTQELDWFAADIADEHERLTNH